MKIGHFIIAILALWMTGACAGATGRTSTINPKTYFTEKPGQMSFSWQMQGPQGSFQEAYRIAVAEKAKDLKAGRKLLWDSGKVASGISVHIPYGGPAPEPGKTYFWEVTVWDGEGGRSSSGPVEFSVPVDASWFTADWIAVDEELNFAHDAPTRLAARYLRHEFELKGGIKKATLRICGLGSSVCHINGRPVSDDVFGPHPTWYRKASHYLTYDVTGMLRKGANAIGVELGNGRYMGMRQTPTIVFGVPRLLAEIQVEYRNGKTEVIRTDGSWKATAQGPIIANNEFDGEEYDARLELGEWTKPGYEEDGRWKAADIVSAPGEELRQQLSPCLKVHESLTPVSVHACPDGRVIVDMGQNMVGWLKVNLRTYKDSTVTMRFAETLSAPDTLYMANLRTAKVTDKYTAAKDGGFSWEPEFVYHGFRYAEISGLDYVPEASAFEGKVVYDGMATTGSFECSDEILNAIHRNAYWGIRGNYRGMPTDCPQRDERMGWLGDRATGCFGESFIFGNELLYYKWILDIDESQREDGRLSSVSPHYWNPYHLEVTWSSTLFYGSEMLYRQYGNVDVIKNRYQAMRRYVECMVRDNMKDGLLWDDCYGDWCMPPESPELIHSKDPSRKTSKPVLSNTVFYDILRKMENYCVLAGHPEDKEGYKLLADSILERFNDKYFDAEKGCYDNNTVTANILALHLGMVPEGHEEDVMRNIVEKTENDWGGHVSAGVVGIQHLMRGLTEYGQKDLAFRIASADTYPSWGYMIRNGATTIWELWNGNTADPAMNSGNHVMLLGDLIIWMYENLAGIKCADDAVAFKKLDMAPVIPEGLTHVSASFDSPYGTVRSAWSTESGEFRWNVSIPANTSATLRFPDGSVKEVGSGDYSF